jgi:ribosomal protein S18 acetylase RimI-like enzyme
MISTAQPADIQQLLPLVNSAFRGDSARKGWTHESDLIEGTIRTDEETMRDMMQASGAAFLKYAEAEGGQVLGCVYLCPKPRGLYLGMLTVDPECQAQGIGKKLLYAAEDYARSQNCPGIYMTVISERPELTDWYVRHGYSLTGETEPFLVEEKYGTPTKPFDFLILEKKVLVSDER